MDRLGRNEWNTFIDLFYGIEYEYAKKELVDFRVYQINLLTNHFQDRMTNGFIVLLNITFFYLS